jgi:hypothetical protein
MVNMKCGVVFSIKIQNLKPNFIVMKKLGSNESKRISQLLCQKDIPELKLMLLSLDKTRRIHKCKTRVSACRYEWSMNMATKNARYFTVIAMLMTLLLFPPFSAMGRQETTTNSRTTTTIVTNQDGSSENETSSSSSSSIIDKTQDLTQSGIGSMAENIGERVDKLISSTTTNTTPVQLSGKIASSRINLNNGNVEQVLFGDWSVNVRSIDDASFVADFSAHSSNSSNNQEDAHYRIGNLKLTSLQRTNENIALGGTVDVAEEKGARTWEESPVTILLINDRAIVIRFEQQGLNEVFSNQPIIGVVVASQ